MATIALTANPPAVSAAVDTEVALTATVKRPDNATLRPGQHVDDSNLEILFESGDTSILTLSGKKQKEESIDSSTGKATTKGKAVGKSGKVTVTAGPYDVDELAAEAAEYELAACVLVSFESDLSYVNTSAPITIGTPVATVTPVAAGCGVVVMSIDANIAALGAQSVKTLKVTTTKTGEAPVLVTKKAGLAPFPTPATASVSTPVLANCGSKTIAIEVTCENAPPVVGLPASLGSVPAGPIPTGVTVSHSGTCPASDPEGGTAFTVAGVAASTLGLNGTVTGTVAGGTLSWTISWTGPYTPIPILGPYTVTVWVTDAAGKKTVKKAMLTTY